jgi:hypothetical protein
MWKQNLAVARRAAAAIALAATVLLAPAPAGAKDIHGWNYVPEARIQIALNKLYIKDDHDWGSGEMWFQVRLHCDQVLEPCVGLPSATLDVFDRSFSASSGETIWFNVVLPQSTELMNPSWGIEIENGYPLTSEQTYTVSVHLWEKDPLNGGEDLGKLEIPVNKGNGWGIGSYPLWSGGNYQVGLEIRPAPLPDLEVSAVKLLDLPGSTKKLVCAAVKNVGVVDAGYFEVVFEFMPTDNSPLIHTNTFAGHLLRGESGEICAEIAPPAAGKYDLLASANLQGPQREFNHLNNTLRQPYTPAKTASAPAPEPEPSPAPVPALDQADLTITAIKVNGQVPDGKNDCKDGKNDLAVVVKNAGTSKAGSFVVRLTIDGENPVEQTVNGLDAGKEREVRFEDVRLKKGEHKLAATVDPKGSIAESDEQNNDRTVTATCRDAT